MGNQDPIYYAPIGVPVEINGEMYIFEKCEDRNGKCHWCDLLTSSGVCPDVACLAEERADGCSAILKIVDE